MLIATATAEISQRGRGVGWGKDKGGKGRNLEAWWFS